MAAQRSRNPRKGTPERELVAFSSSLEQSLDKNRTLQQKILSSLQLLGSEMAENRRMASRLTRELHLVSEEEADANAEHPAARGPLAKVDDGQGQQQQEVPPLPIRGTSHNHTTILSKDADPYRPWRRPFFADPSGSTSEPSPDTLQRRRFYRDNDYFFYHLSPPWSKDERKVFGAILKEEEEKNKKNENNDSTMIDFQTVALELEKRAKRDKDLPFQKPRSSYECEIQYQRLQSEQQSAITKAEVKQILDLVHQYSQADGKEESIIDWYEIAKQVGNDRSPWKCFVAYQRAKNSSSLWTPHQDELLFKYLCAMGPQFVTSLQSCGEIALELFPDKTVKQIAERSNLSLLNPKLHRAAWTDMEERKLVLAQKLYRDNPQRPAGHFPHRGSKSVRDKWIRTLDPAFTKSRPFTKKEDTLLSELVGTCLKQLKVGSDDLVFTSSDKKDDTVTDKIPWTKLAREHFPDRRPEQICDRWTRVLASDKDILQNIKAKLAKKQRGVYHHGTAAGNSGSERESSATTATANAASLDDFELQLVPKAKRKRKRS